MSAAAPLHVFDRTQGKDSMLINYSWPLVAAPKVTSDAPTTAGASSTVLKGNLHANSQLGTFIL